MEILAFKLDIVCLYIPIHSLGVPLLEAKTVDISIAVKGLYYIVYQSFCPVV